eukprot:403341179
MIKAFTLNKRQFSFEYMKASILGSVEFITQNIDDHIVLNNIDENDNFHDQQPGNSPNRLIEQVDNDDDMRTVVSQQDVRLQLSQKIMSRNKFEKTSDNQSLKSFVQEAYEQFIQKSVRVESPIENAIQIQQQQQYM